MRGVVSVSIDRRTNEAAVVRQQGTAPGGTLVAAVRRVGYTASVIPTLRFERDVPGLAPAGAAERAHKALLAERGVRGVFFRTRTHFTVFYDGRKTDEGCLTRAIERVGIDCASRG